MFIITEYAKEKMLESLRDPSHKTVFIRSRLIVSYNESLVFESKPLYHRLKDRNVIAVYFGSGFTLNGPCRYNRLAIQSESGINLAEAKLPLVVIESGKHEVVPKFQIENGEYVAILEF